MKGLNVEVKEKVAIGLLNKPSRATARFRPRNIRLSHGKIQVKVKADEVELQQMRYSVASVFPR